MDNIENMVKAAGHDISLLINRILKDEINWQNMKVADREDLVRQTIYDAMKAFQ